jgi:hypothetical protein
MPSYQRATLARQLGPAAALGLPEEAVRAFLFSLACLAALLALPGRAAAQPPVLIGPEDGAQGRPKIVLDQLVVPNDVPERKRVSAVLERVLKHEAHRVQWGAGRASRISYRFFLEELSTSVEHGVLRVRCTALGRLPQGKSARSKLEFGGDPREPRQVVDHVLTIVARGVLARLADLERDRRIRK